MNKCMLCKKKEEEFTYCKKIDLCKECGHKLRQEMLEQIKTEDEMNWDLMTCPYKKKPKDCDAW